jgi:CHASE2 domain-containing sensor protein
MIASTVEFGLALFGLVFLWRTQRAAALLIGTVTITFALGYALFVAKLRYRIPVLPLVFVLAGVGAWKLGAPVIALLAGRIKAGAAPPR